jgi:Spy/CpxP family protein refolding chaperone
MNHRFSFPRSAALLAFVVCLVSLPASAQGFKWWQSDRFKQELQLTDDQIARIEELFQAWLQESRRQKKALDRAALSKARTLMLVRIRRVLSPEQRLRLAQLHDEWERNRRRDRDRK